MSPSRCQICSSLCSHAPSHCPISPLRTLTYVQCNSPYFPVYFLPTGISTSCQQGPDLPPPAQYPETQSLARGKHIQLTLDRGLDGARHHRSSQVSITILTCTLHQVFGRQCDRAKLYPPGAMVCRCLLSALTLAAALMSIWSALWQHNETPPGMQHLI